MKINKLYSSVAAGLLLVAASASAQYSAGNNSLIVGFSNTVNNIEINLGTAVVASGPGSYNLGNYGSILSNATTGFGANWATTSTLTFGAIDSVSGSFGATGLNNEPKATSYASSAWTTTSGTLGVQNSGLPDTNSYVLGNGGTVNTKFTTMNNTANSANATVVMPNQAVSMTSGTAGSWDSVANPATGSSFGTFTTSAFNQAVTANNGTFVAMDLYKYSPSLTPVFMGTLSLATSGASAGTLTYTVAGAAIPEPSTYAAILGVATLGFAAIRRRKQQLEVQA